MEITTALLYTCGGLALLTSIHHFFISFHGVNKEEHLNFAIAVAPMILYVYAMEMIYSAETVEQIINANRIQMFCVPIFFIFYGRFASFFCKRSPSLFQILLSIIVGIMPFIRIFSKTLLTYTNIKGVKKVTLIWGEEISQLDAQTTSFATFYYLLIFIFAILLIKLSIDAIKGSKFENGKALFVSMMIFIFTAINDVVVDALNLNWMYIGEYGFILIILVISFYLSKDVYRASVLKKQMEKSEKLLSTILENASSIIFVKDINGKYLVANDELGKILKLDKSEIIGKRDSEIFDDHVAESFALNDNSVKRTGESAQFEEAIPHDDGPHMYVSNKFPIFNKEGEIFAIGSVSTDISEKRDLEVRLRQSEKMQAVGQLAGGVAHDFNNQLAGIIGYADMIKERCEDDPSISDYINNILLAAKRSSELTGQLLAFARKGKYQSVTVNIHEIIEETIALLKRSISKKIAIRKCCDSESPFVRGDATQLQNVILNLSVNSCDAMKEGGELIISTQSTFLDEAFCKKSTYMIKPGMFLQISVEDDGDGISEDIINRIFEPFFTTKKPGKGTGMGLSAVYGTVKNHNGAIEVETEKGKGTKITIYLPEVNKFDENANEEQDSNDLIKGSGTIMIVDDESVIRKMLSRTLPSLGYNVKDFEMGKDAVKYFKEHFEDIDLVILDMIMPEMDGRDVFKALKEINPNVKILLSSGFSVDGDAQKLINEGAEGFIHKPYRKVELSKQIADILQK